MIDSGRPGTAWTSLSAGAWITQNALLTLTMGISVFMASSDNLAGIQTNPVWQPVGALNNGNTTTTFSSLPGIPKGQYARYKVVLWRGSAQQATPILNDITLNYETVPGAIAKTVPASGSSNQSQPVNLQWTSAADATSYEYCTDTSNNNQCDTAWVTAGGSTTFPLSGLTAGTQYFWQVRACNTAGCNAGADNGTWWTFITRSKPTDFSKAAPANGQQHLNAGSVQLTWNAATSADSYEYCVGVAQGDCSVVAFTNIGASLNATVLTLNPGTTYYWQVRARNSEGTTDANSGSYWSFRTESGVGPFNKQAPGNSAVNVNTATAQLQWTPAQSATSYLVCLGTTANLCNVLGGGAGVFANVGNTQFRVLSNLGLQPNTTYYWQVLATNGVYTQSANGGSLDFWNFTTLPTGPGGFNKQAPAVGATNVPTTNVPFAWTASSGAVTYTVCIGAYTGDCAISFPAGGGLSTVYPGTLAAGMTYLWQVFAHNAGGATQADNSAWHVFSTLNPPGAFHKLLPADGATNQPPGVQLTWESSMNATSYQVCVSTASGVCDVYSATVGTTSAAVTGLSFGHTYFWQVTAMNGATGTQADGGTRWQLTIMNPPQPGPFAKQTPTNNAFNVPTQTSQVLLSWGLSSEANYYEVCFGTQPGLCDLSGGGYQGQLGGTSVLVSALPFAVTLQPAHTYWWQVRAVNTTSGLRTQADQGVAFAFTTVNQTPPGGFYKQSPSNNAYNVPTASVTLNWSASAGATSYAICVGTAANQCNALPGSDWLPVGNNLQSLISNLSPATTYFWQVRSVNGSSQMAQADGGAWWTFTTQNLNPPENFYKLSPLNGAYGVPTASVALAWSASTGASDYAVCVGSSPGVCDFSGGFQSVGVASQWTISSLQATTTYWWQVRASNAANGVFANAGTWWYFTTLNPPPPAPAAFSKQSPFNGATDVPTTSTALSWGAASGATGYAVCIGTQAGLCDVTNNQFVTAPGGAVTSLNLNNLGLVLQASTTYWWQVKAVNAGSETLANGGQFWHFTTRAPGGVVQAFHKLSPANNATNQPTTLNVAWQAAVGATSYEVCVGSQPGLCDASSGWQSTTNLQSLISNLQPATTYFWQVRAVNGSTLVFADGGMWWTFTTANAACVGCPGVFSKTVPLNDAIGVALTTTLQWTAASGASDYAVCVGSQPGLCDFSGPWPSVGASPQSQVTNLAPATTYWWQVRAIGGGGFVNADAGRWFNFTTQNVANGPGAFGKTLPLDGAHVTSSVSLNWTASSGAVRYEICVGTAWGLCDIINNVDVGLNLQSQLSNLSAGAYWWQVRAFDANGVATQADGGTRWQFTVVTSGIADLVGSTKTATPASVKFGQAVTYTIVLSNTGLVAATPAVTDVLQSQAVYKSASPAPSSAPAVGANGTLVWNGVSVPAGQSVTLTVVVTATAGGIITQSYSLGNSAVIGMPDGSLTRDANGVSVEPWRAYLPITLKP